MDHPVRRYPQRPEERIAPTADAHRGWASANFKEKIGSARRDGLTALAADEWARKAFTHLTVKRP